MKTCTKCNIEKSLSEFRERKNRASGFYSACRECESKYNEKYRKNNKEKIKKLVQLWRKKEHNNTWKVYILPNSDYYVGQTKAIKPRIYRHRQDGRDCSDYMILHICDTKKEALEYEAIYHKLGLPGKKE